MNPIKLNAPKSLSSPEKKSWNRREFLYVSGIGLLGAALPDDLNDLIKWQPA
jgi:hypothetical protein